MKESSKKNRNFIWGALLLMLIQIQLQAQSEFNRIVKKYSIQEGLSQAVVNSITQDDKGLMWFATDDGFNRFDGYSFNTFKFAMEGAQQFHDNFVQCIFKDSKGKLWISSRRGLYWFDLSTQQLSSYMDADTTHLNDVSFISEGASGDLWIAWYWGGFASFDKKARKFSPYSKTQLPSLTSTATIAIMEDSYGYLWVGTQDKGLNVFKLNKSKPSDINEAQAANDLLPSLYVKCFLEDHLGNVWIGTTKGLVVYLRKDNRYYVFADDSPIAGKPIFSLLQDSNKKLWIGTQGTGLYNVNLRDFDGRRTEKLAFRHVDVLDQYNVSQLTIRSLFEDKDKNLWIGTHGDGIYMIGNEEKKFVKIRTRKILNASESFVSYFGMCNDADGFIWVGTDGDGLFKMDRNGKVIRHYTADGKKGSIPDNSVVTAYRDLNDNLWFGTYSNGLLLYDKASDSFRQFQHADSPVPLRNQVRMIFEDSKRSMWIGACRGGLCLLDEKGNSFRHYSSHPALRTEDVRAMVEDKSGVLWIGSYGNGLYYFNPQTDELRSIFNGTGPNNPLKSNVVYALALDNKNRLWIGTGGGGLGVYNINDKTLKRYSSDKDGLINDTVYGLGVDDDGNVWISTIKGLSKLDPEKEQFYNYTSSDGLQEGQFNPGAALVNQQEGYMCFGGTAGLNIFYPSNVVFDAKPPKVMISGFQLFNRPVKIGTGNDGEFVLDKVIDETEKIVLKPKESVFTFQFTGLNYNYPEKNRYAYKLEGIDPDWNYSESERSVTYRYLSPGSYTFKVKATNHDNAWPKDFASVKLEILPPFWKTPLAYLLYAIAIALMVYVVYSVRKRQEFLRRRLIIEKNQRKRERQLVQEKLSFFTEVSHEFRTPLTLMIGPLEEILTREGTFTPAGKKLRMVYKNAFKLLHLINKLLDYRKIETGNLVLRVKEDNIVAFVEEIYITFKEMAIRRKINFEFHSEVPSILTWFDKEKLEMALNNILSNSFKYIGHGNSICIHIRQTDDPEGPAKVVIEIKDNGIGIKKEDLRYIFDWFYQGNSNHPLSSGIGLALAKKLVYLHKGQIYVSSTEGKGSLFTIKIPIGKDHFNEHEVVFDDHTGIVLSEPNPSIINDVPESEEGSHKKGLKSILVVEDDDEVRNFIVKYFERDYKLFEATNGKEGVEAAIEKNPNLIISDVMMPEMNGVDLCKEIKSNIKTSHIPVILLTAKTSFTHHKEGLEIGADYYVTKPFSPEMLNLTINNLFQSQENLKRFYRSMFIDRGTEKKEITSPDEHLLQKLYEIVKANLDKPAFNLDHVCEELTMSRSLLYKKVKTLTGLSPNEYVRSIRLSEAAALLKTQQYKVFEVVYMVGFSDLKYFRECFTKEFGYPPSQLLKSVEVEKS